MGRPLRNSFSTSVHSTPVRPRRSSPTSAALGPDGLGMTATLLENGEQGQSFNPRLSYRPDAPPRRTRCRRRLVRFNPHSARTECAAQGDSTPADRRFHQAGRTLPRLPRAPCTTGAQSKSSQPKEPESGRPEIGDQPQRVHPLTHPFSIASSLPQLRQFGPRITDEVSISAAPLGSTRLPSRPPLSALVLWGLRPGAGRTSQ